MKPSPRIFCLLIACALTFGTLKAAAAAQGDAAAFAGKYKGKVVIRTTEPTSISSGSTLEAQLTVFDSGAAILIIAKANQVLHGRVDAQGKLVIRFGNNLQFKTALGTGTVDMIGRELVPIGLFNLQRGYHFTLTKQ